MKMEKSQQIHYQQLYANNMDNMEEMDKFLEKHNFPKLNQQEIENLKRPITSTEIETAIRNLPANKSPGPDDFTANSTNNFEKLRGEAERWGKPTWAFVCWKRSDYSFNFRACDGSVKIFYFFLVQFWKIVLF